MTFSVAAVAGLFPLAVLAGVRCGGVLFLLLLFLVQDPYVGIK